jgi:EF hand
MRIQLAGFLMAASMSWLAAQGPGQPPPRGQRPPQDRGDQDPGRPPRPDDDGPDGPPPPPFGPPPNLLFNAIDVDGDGELSPKEIAKASQSIAKLDTNKDGIITEDEVRPPRPGGRRGPPGGGPPEGEGPPGGGPPGGGPPGAGGRAQDAKPLVDSVMKFDKDGDGKISAAELPERMARMMEEGDANKDGFLDRSEVEALSRRPAARRPGGAVGGPPAPPPGGPSADNEDHGRPVEQVARELGVTPEKFREVFRKVRPAGPGQQPTEAQRRRNRKVLSEGLGVSPERLDEVMDKYRPGGRGDNGPR